MSVGFLINFLEAHKKITDNEYHCSVELKSNLNGNNAADNLSSFIAIIRKPLGVQIGLRDLKSIFNSQLDNINE